MKTKNKHSKTVTQLKARVKDYLSNKSVKVTELVMHSMCCCMC